jgi:UDP-2,3-diacylglucosamine pyrophosphatase LpxH
LHKRTLILADLHLTRHTPEVVSRDLVRLVEAHHGANLVFAGDLFDLSAEAASSRDDGTSPGRLERGRNQNGIEEGLRRYPDVARSFAEHVDRDGALYVVSGNHDAEMGTGNMPASIADILGLRGDARARIHTTPWFFRLGNVHVEHGHLYDPDNAPAHPLVVSARSLGVHFVEQFIAPTGAFAFLNANDSTPLKLFVSSFAWYGKRAPYVIYRFFHAATTALLTSGPFFDGERARAAAGHERLPAFAAGQGLSVDAAERVLALRAAPTLESMRRTFARLYLDRVLATVGVAGGLTALGFGHPLAGGAFASAGAAIMAASWATGHDRYKGNVAERLERGARAVAEASGAKLVVFGHTHREAIAGAYANTGSFAFPGRAPGRPFLEIEGSLEAPRVTRRYF